MHLLSHTFPVGASGRRSDLPAKNADAVQQIHRGAWFAGKPRSYRRRTLTRYNRYTAAPGSRASLAPTGTFASKPAPTKVQRKAAIASTDSRISAGPL
ncbi:hypothetical protein PS639_02020 [Pseudomonas fluorescens]|nr:hypothetical protein PS639_02020 [Pseudomonas fluorescens]